MSTKQNPKKNPVLTDKNTAETLTNFGSSTLKNTGNAFKNLGSGIFDSFFGAPGMPGGDENWGQNEFGPRRQEAKKPAPLRKEVHSVYSFQKEQEIRTMRELTEQLKREIIAFKKQSSDVLSEVKDIEKMTIDSLPSKPGIYHIRFLEIVLSILRTLRQKIGESKTWMQALMSKKKKRGSLFAVRSKKQGTQYSMSEEMKMTRSVQ